LEQARCDCTLRNAQVVARRAQTLAGPVRPPVGGLGARLSDLHLPSDAAPALKMMEACDEKRSLWSLPRKPAGIELQSIAE
jgi:hypothetical protein